MRQLSRVTICIIGGGVAGAATASLLQQAGISTLVIDKAAAAIDSTEPTASMKFSESTWKVGEGLPPSAKPYLQQLGVWEKFVAANHLPSYGNRSVWGQAEVAEYSFLYDPYGCGWHLDRLRFDRMLAAHAQQLGVPWLGATALEQSERTSDGKWQLILASEQDGQVVVEADFVVDATGRPSTFARQQGAKRILDDQLVGCVHLFSTDAGEKTDREKEASSGSATDSLEAYTFIEATPQGWWYTAPLPEQRRMVAFMSDGDLTATQAARQHEGWERLLTQTKALSTLLDSCCATRMTDKPRIYSANSSRLSFVAGEDWLAVGDAAMAYDPLSSQGILMALVTGNEAAQAIRARLHGHHAALEQYAEQMRRIYVEYFVQRSRYYGMERRFAEEVFWERRHG